ncbi:MAG: hypothetical protein IJI14_08145, partial [Anaerolineaceae bacterium]|nr:hypothetical protein [Anaerolineaceae bacterium]
NKYANIYNIIINNFTVPEDTPEHNQMQVLFLHEDFLHKIILHLFPAKELISKSISQNISYNNSKIREIKIEKECSEINYPKPNDPNRISDEECEKWIKEIKEAIEYYSNSINESNVIDRIETDFEVYGWDVRAIAYTYKNGFRTPSLYFELKPSIGDDYPTVLREMKTHGSTIIKQNEQYISKRCLGSNDKENFPRFILVYDKFSAEGVSEQDMTKIFEKSGFIVIPLKIIKEKTMA